MFDRLREVVTSIHPLFAVGATVLVAVTMTFGQLGGLPRTDNDLPFPAIERDIQREVVAVQEALLADSTPTDHFRPPGALLLLIPTLALPPDYLTWSAAAIGWFALAAIVFVVSRDQPAKGLLVGLVIATSGAYLQTVFHGSLFVVVAALVTWSWVEIRNDSELLGVVLLGAAVTLRPWLILIVFGLVAIRRRRQAILVLFTVAMLNTLGLLLFAGVTVSSTLESGRLSLMRWLPASHNGSIAALMPGSPLAAAWGGLIIGLLLWVVGLKAIKSGEFKLAWTLPLSVLASPLAWMPYLLVNIPLSMREWRHRVAAAFLSLGVLLATAGSWWLDDRLVTIGSSVFLGLAVVTEARIEPAPAESALVPGH